MSETNVTEIKSLEGHPLMDEKARADIVALTEEMAKIIEEEGNYWTHGDVTFTQMQDYAVELPAGSYTLRAKITSNDTDGTQNTVSVLSTTGSSLAAKVVDRDTFFDIPFTTDGTIVTVRAYASNAWNESKGDTATITDAVIFTGVLSGTVTAIDRTARKQIKELQAGGSTSIAWKAPEKYELVVGDTFELFYAGIIDTPRPEQMYFKAVCDMGNAFRDKYTVTPNVAGDHTLTLTAYDVGMQELDSVTITLSVKAKASSPATEKVVLYVGDSLAVNGVVAEEFHRRLCGSGGSPTGAGLANIRFIGTQTSKTNNVPYEGYGGWSFAKYNAESTDTFAFWVTAQHGKTAADQHSIYKDANGTQWKIETIESTRLKMIRVSGSAAMPASGTLTWVSGGSDNSAITFSASANAPGNPFWDTGSGKVDFFAYAQRMGVTRIDYVYVLLGWNNQLDDASEKANVIKFVSNVHAAFPSCKIVLMGLQKPSENGLAQNYGASDYWNISRQMQRVWQIDSVYADVASGNAKVYSVNISGQFDTAHNMQASEQPVNVRSTEKEMRQNNGVHPAEAGYLQIADAAYRSFMHRLQD